MTITEKIRGGEKGQALPMVMVLLMLGSLTVVPVLDHATTTLRAGQAIEQSVDGIFAADAGVEYAYWCLENGATPPSQLAEMVNGMQVNLDVDSEGTYTLYFGQLVEASGHFDYLLTEGEIVWDEGAMAYRYTITITWQPHPGTPTIHLKEVGARLPPGFSYVAGSAAGFASNLSADEPDQVLDSLGATMVNWELPPPLPSVTEEDPVATQTFYITGEQPADGEYAWVVADRNDVGAVGNITGGVYVITATAILPSTGETTAKIVADVMQLAEGWTIASWQISK